MPYTLDTSLHLPLSWYRTMREKDPVSFDPRYKLWSVFRYYDAQHILTNHVTFSSQPDGVSQQPALPSILGMDPPRHRKLRTLVSSAFTPRVIAQLEPKITHITNELLAPAFASGQMEVIQDLAYPLPITIIAELLGVPPEDRANFRRWSQTLVSGPRFNQDPQALQKQRQNLEEFNNYFTQKLAERRQEPRDDLMSRLVTAEVDNEQLSKQELLDFCRLLLIAGHETTANLIGNAVVYLEEHPALAEALRQDPLLMPSTVEEFLRCFTSVVGATRVTTTDTEVGGKHIPHGQAISVWVASANYDEAQFSDPERFDPRRDPNHHLTFGYGIHFCLGAPLARLEARLVLNILLESFSEIKRIAHTVITPITSPFILGIERFPVTVKRRRTHLP